MCERTLLAEELLADAALKAVSLLLTLSLLVLRLVRFQLSLLTLQHKLRTQTRRHDVITVVQRYVWNIISMCARVWRMGKVRLTCNRRWFSWYDCSCFVSKSTSVLCRRSNITSLSLDTYKPASKTRSSYRRTQATKHAAKPRLVQSDRLKVHVFQTTANFTGLLQAMFSGAAKFLDGVQCV